MQMKTTVGPYDIYAEVEENDGYDDAFGYVPIPPYVSDLKVFVGNVDITEDLSDGAIEWIEKEVLR